MNDPQQRAETPDVAAMLMQLINDVEPAQRSALADRMMTAAQRAAEELEVPWVVGNTLGAAALLSMIYLAFRSSRHDGDADGHYLAAFADGFGAVWQGIAAASATKLVSGAE